MTTDILYARAEESFDRGTEVEGHELHREGADARSGGACSRIVLGMSLLAAVGRVLEVGVRKRAISDGGHRPEMRRSAGEDRGMRAAQMKTGRFAARSRCGGHSGKGIKRAHAEPKCTRLHPATSFTRALVSPTAATPGVCARPSRQELS